MARIKVKLPENFIFTTEIPLRISDINYGGHLGHDVFLPIAHEARIQFLDKMGYTEMDLGGFGIVISGVVIEYIKEAFYGDNLIVNLAVDKFHNYGFDIIYQLVNKKDNTEIGRVITAIVLFDYSIRKVARLPDQVVENIKNIQINDY
ncbi:MAG: acyl-CoA thioesterase [Thermodesulfobacteriota bacterium]